MVGGAPPFEDAVRATAVTVIEQLAVIAAVE